MNFAVRGFLVTLSLAFHAQIPSLIEINRFGQPFPRSKASFSGVFVHAKTRWGIGDRRSDVGRVQIPRNKADTEIFKALEIFQSASTETAFLPRSTWLI